MTLRDMALEKMRAAIIAGHFQSGDRLVERPLCDQLGVSRSVVRETIRYLEAEGLVEILPNKGPIVAKLDWENAQQIYEIRMLLETSAAQKCAELAKDGDKKKLGKASASSNPRIAAARPMICLRQQLCFISVFSRSADRTWHGKLFSDSTVASAAYVQ